MVTETVKSVYLNGLTELFVACLVQTEKDIVNSNFSKDCLLLVTGNPLDIPFSGSYLGQVGVEDYFSKIRKDIKFDDIETQCTLIENNNVDIHLRLKGVFKKSKSKFDLEWVYGIETKDDKIVKVTLFYDTHTFRLGYYSKSPISVSDLKNSRTLEFNRTDEVNYRPLIERGYNAFYFNNDPDGFIGIMDEDITFISKGDVENTPYSNIYNGHEGLQQFLKDIVPNFIPKDLVILSSVQMGNRINYRVYEEGFSTPTGKSYKITVLQSFLIKDNKVIEFKTYNDSYAVGQSYCWN